MNCHADVERERINQRSWTMAVQPAPSAIPRLQRAPAKTAPKKFIEVI